jgi:SAM-dependent methyltransferase
MKKAPRATFDDAYYGRYYESEGTRVYGHEEQQKLAQGVLAFASYWGREVSSVLDVGAGTGQMRAVFAKAWPKIRYTTTEVSAYACKKYGHERLDITKERWDLKFDLIICQGVLPYLTDAGATAAIANIGKMAGGFLYLEAITKRDIVDVVDKTKTDLAVYPRRGAFYESRLKKAFVKLGAGMYYTRSGPLTFYELEMGG